LTEGKRLDLLSGLRVLELGDGVAGSACGSALWALGADVVAAIDPSSPHRRGRPAVAGRSLLSAVLDRGKHLVDARGPDALDTLLEADVDVVVFDRVGGTTPELTAIDAYVSFVDARSPGAWVTISAFGLSGPRATDVATELTVAAASGPLATVRDPSNGHPLKIAGQQSLLNTGQAAALAVCHAFDAAGEGPVHLDLSALEATIATGPVLEISSVTLGTGTHVGARRYGAPAGFYACTDGLIRISAMEDHQWRGVVAAMGAPAWAEAFAKNQARIDAPEEVDARIAEWTRTLTKGEAEAVLQRNGVPATGMYSPAEILRSPQLAHRDAFESLPLDDGRVATIVGAPFMRVGESSAAPRRRSLRGLKVLEAGHVLAVPLSGALLGALGADVSKLEDTGRIDMYRRRGPYVDGVAGEERSAYFAFTNHSKRSVAFDVDAERDRLAAMVDDADVVVENLGTKRALALDLAASTVVRAHPDLLALSSSGFGQDGPQASYRAYAYNLQAACGFCYLTRNEHGETAEVDLAWADLISAYTLATIVAAWAVGPKGNPGMGFDYAMADLISGHFNEFFAAASLDASSDDELDRGNELAPFAPHGVYPASDGWLAIAIDGDDGFGALAEVLDRAALRDERFSSSAARFARRDELDGLVAEATAGWPAAKLAGALRTAGVVAEEVLAAPLLVDVPQLVARGFFTEVEHPEWGRRRIVGVPWRRYGEPPIALGAAPRLGRASGE
jgi:crotonobetainyl-CoA:carnitine CoA-transferase CaiB-like acyl-CoA transferase